MVWPSSYSSGRFSLVFVCLILIALILEPLALVACPLPQSAAAILHKDQKKKDDKQTDSRDRSDPQKPSSPPRDDPSEKSKSNPTSPLKPPGFGNSEKEPPKKLPAIQQPADQKQDDEEERRQQRRERRIRRSELLQPGDSVPLAETSGRNVLAVMADQQSKNGDLFIYEGFVDASVDEMRLQADRVTYNSVTGDMSAEGNVIFDQGDDQRVTANRADINWNTRKGTFINATGFTNRTQTGDYVYFTAERVEKTGELTYELYNAEITACEDAVPKWRFSARRAELKMGDRVILHNAVFRIKGFPAFVLPYAWIPATRSERKSGFLLPTTGSSNQKGRTMKFAYYQTLGQSADVTFRNDIYTSRGLGFGAEFRAQTDEESFMRLGIFTVKDRLFGPPGEDQGGTAFVGEGVQRLPHGWLLVGNASLVTSLAFRQVFSDDISQVIDPRRESTFYANNNTGNFSFSILANNETTRVFRPLVETSGPSTTTGIDFDIKIRQAPEINLVMYPRRVYRRVPIYFGFDLSLSSLKREETVDGETVLVTPAAVQRFDFHPKITIPLATVAGFAITPSISFRQTLYGSSIDPDVPLFNPGDFTLSPLDPRLNPKNSLFDPKLNLFDRSLMDPIIPRKVSRYYGELAVDIRPPSLEKTFYYTDGTQRFKHLIEPYITYRLIEGIGDEFNQIIRFDESDAVANTNEFEYAIVNRFFSTTHASELGRRRRRRGQQPDDMKPVQPPRGERKRNDNDSKDTSAEETEAAVTDERKAKLESGKQDELSRENNAPARSSTSNPRRGEQLPARDRQNDDPDDDDSNATNEDSPVEAFEFLTIRVAQKYFLDETFGGALIEGRRNQFYPINTLTGFTFGGRARSFSPLNLSVRYRPLSAVFADVRLDVGSEDKLVRNATVGGGVSSDKLTISANWHLARRIVLDSSRFESGTFAGNQLDTTFQYGDGTLGLYAGTRVGYEFTDRLIDEELSTGRLRSSRSYAGYAWDCCGVQFNYNTFKAGIRSESAFSFTFTLAGLGSFGTDQFSQLGGGRGGRRRGRRNRAIDDF